MAVNVEKRIGILVVAYNAASTLIDTLDRIPTGFRDHLSEIIVLDDASVDNTFELAKSWANRPSVHTTLVVRHARNLGYGGNQKAAYALAESRGLDIVVLLHGDGQYAPERLPEMVQPLLREECDAVFGSRMMVKGDARAGGMPGYKRIGNRILTKIENCLLGTSLSEFHSGYRAYSMQALQSVPYECNSDGFNFDTQIIVQLVDAGKRITEIPIPTFYGDEICYVNGLRYAAAIVRDVLEYRLCKIGLPASAWLSAAGPDREPWPVQVRRGTRGARPRQWDLGDNVSHGPRRYTCFAGDLSSALIGHVDDWGLKPECSEAAASSGQEDSISAALA